MNFNGAVGVSAYVVVAGTTGSCPTCALVTNLAGLPFKDVGGKTVKSSEFGGKVVILDF